MRLMVGMAGKISDVVDLMVQSQNIAPLELVLNIQTGIES